MGLARRLALVAATALAAAVLAPAAGAHDHRHPSDPPDPPAAATSELATFAAPGCVGGCGSGSTVGPDGALYVTDGPGGRVVRIDPTTGAQSTYAHGLPAQIAAVGIGGAMDVAFRGSTAYVLVTLEGTFFGQPSVVDGLYRVNADGGVTPVADIGSWSIAHPPTGFDFFVTSGVQYALQPYHGGFLVTDGHHNRVLSVSTDGDIEQVATFGDIVPTGLDTHGHDVLMSQAGPVPHLPENGKVHALDLKTGTDEIVATGARLAVDVELGCGNELFALSQGVWTLDPTDESNEGKPASANTGVLFRQSYDGSLVPVASGLDRPTSMELVGDTAYVVTLTGKVLRVTDVCGHGGHDDDD
jgi:hypothetical protein